MALTSTDTAAVLSKLVKDWGLNSNLSLEERRCMRCVCHELRLAVDAQTDTLVIRLDYSNCDDTETAKSMAQFHGRQPAAKQLVVHMSYGWAKEKDASSFMAAYSAHCQANGLQGITHCHISIMDDCQMQLGPITSLLSALPSLEAIMFQREEGMPNMYMDVPAKVLGLLAGCKHLHTLAVNEGFAPAFNVPDYDDEYGYGGLHEGVCEEDLTPGETYRVEGVNKAALFKAIPLVKQLRVLSLDMHVEGADLAPLRSLPQLEVLCFKRLAGAPGAHPLPTIRELRAAMTTAECLHGPPSKGWHPSLQGLLDGDLLPYFPNLQRLGGITIENTAIARAGHTVRPKAWLLPAVKQAAAAAHSWAVHWHVLPSQPPVQELRPGCLDAVRHLMVSSGETGPPLNARLSCLLAAAPHTEALCLQLVSAGWTPKIKMDTLSSVLPQLLQPLQNAKCVHTLWLCVSVAAPSTQDEVLAAVASYLRGATSHASAAGSRSSSVDRSIGSSSGTGMIKPFFPSLKRVHVWSGDGEEWPGGLRLEL